MSSPRAHSRRPLSYNLTMDNQEPLREQTQHSTGQTGTGQAGTGRVSAADIRYIEIGPKVQPSIDPELADQKPDQSGEGD